MMGHDLVLHEPHVEKSKHEEVKAAAPTCAEVEVDHGVCGQQEGR